MGVPEPAEFRRRVALKAIGTPLAYLPAGLGALATAGAAVAAPLDAGAAGFLAVLGVTGLVIGVGTALTRLIVRTRELGREVIDEETGAADLARAASDRARADRLADLQRRAEAHGDRAVAAAAFRLRDLAGRLARAGDWTGSASAAESASRTADKAAELFESCVASAGRALQLLEASREMATDEGRRRVAVARDGLLGEVDAGIDKVGLALDRLQAAALTRNDPAADLARARDELAAGLAVAQRVEARMAGLAADLDPLPDRRTER